MAHHMPTSRLQEQGREALEEACLLLEAPHAKHATKTFIMIGEVAEFCDEDVLGAVKCAERAARDVVAVCCCGGTAANRDDFLEAAQEAFDNGLSNGR